MPYYDPSTRATKQLQPGIITRTFWGEHMLAGVVDLAARAVLPEHSHPQEQITYVLQGELHFNLDGNQHTVQAGELIVIPGGMPHSAVVGDADAKALDIFSPVREDMKY